MSKTYTLEEIKKMKSKTDVDFFNKTTEKDIMEQSISDPDTPYLTEDEIKEFTTPEERKKNDGKED
ncbi:MAG TPA: hypothetical protein ENK04_07030 [Gammaproteobacteria bacterium]|nr:hypothetical protein [Gammaproteobacteria bacterium]